MRILFGLATLAAALGATQASAQPQHLSDVAYIQAARCAGLASSKTLGGDGKAMIAWLNSERAGRMEFIEEKAEDAQRDAKVQADHANPYVKSQLQAELEGPCATLKG